MTTDRARVRTGRPPATPPRRQRLERSTVCAMRTGCRASHGSIRCRARASGPASDRSKERVRMRRTRLVTAAVLAALTIMAATAAIASSGGITGFPAKISTVNLAGYKLQTVYPLMRECVAPHNGLVRLRAEADH